MNQWILPLESLQSLAGESLCVLDTLSPSTLVTLDEDGVVRSRVLNAYIGFVDLDLASNAFHRYHKFAFSLEKLTVLELHHEDMGHIRHEKQEVRPPISAEYLFYFFLDAKNCDALVGDLEARYKLMYKKFGHRRAQSWYWKEALSSTGPTIWAWVRNVPWKKTVALLGVTVKLFQSMSR